VSPGGAARGGGRAGGRDLTSGPIARTLILFALPTMGSSVLQSLNASINAVWIGRFLGPTALAATTNASLVMFLLFAAMFGFGMAATIMIGQAFGRRDIDGARRVFGTALGLFLIFGLVVMTGGWLAADRLLDLLRTPTEAHGLADLYLRVILLSVPASFVTVLVTMALRGAGDAVTPLIFMGLTAALDVVLNPLLILGLGPVPALGIAGSALATLIANLAGLAGLLGYIRARDLPIRLSGAQWRYLRPDPAIVKLLLAKGVPMGLQMLVVSVSVLMMVFLINAEGVATIAAFGAANQLWTYIQMPAMAVGAAVSAVAAQNLGAGQWARVEQTTRAGIAINIVMTGLVVLCVILAERPLLGLFLADAGAALDIATHVNRIVAWSWILFGITAVMSATVRANGAVMVPLLILTVALMPVRFGFAVVFGPVLGADAIWWSFPAGSAVSVVLTALYYRFGGWRSGGMGRVPAPPAARAASNLTG